MHATLQICSREVEKLERRSRLLTLLPNDGPRRMSIQWQPVIGVVVLVGIINHWPGTPRP